MAPSVAHSEKIISIIICIFSVYVCQCEDLPSPERVNQLARQIQSSLTTSFLEASAYSTLKNSYISDISSVRFDAVDLEAELAEMASKITAVFTKRTFALERIVQAAEDSTVTYAFDPDVKLEDVQLFKMANYDESSPQLQYNAHFQRQINTSQSGVHTPLEVYEGYPDVLNGLLWSAAVDSVFKENRRRDPDISWQYLGSQVGFLRLYPATWWQPPEHLDNVDLYDVRRRPWYIEAAVSPKDVVIVMDISGSVHGQTFEIMKIAVKTVLNTLGENDYVNVVWSTNHVGWADPCMTSLMPATMVNKRALFAAVDALEARNTSDWNLGMEFAYKAFIDFYHGNGTDRRDEEAGADCNKMIMFFSDGGTEFPELAINQSKKHNTTKDVRIFTYALGPHPVPSHILRQMACGNGGTFSVIVASGAIRTTIQESYLGVLAKPLALSGSHPRAESSSYKDAGGLGYVATLAMPVFNRSQASDGQTLVGVAGVDITMDELHAFSPDLMLGPFGYTFAINPNGIVMFHPRLREPLHYMEDPPDLDLTHIEGNNQVVRDLRTEMIRRKAYSLSMDQTLVLPDGHSVEVRDLTVVYRPIENTTLSLGLITPAGHTQLVASGQSPSAGLPACDACLVASDWSYCPGLDGDGTARWQRLSQLLRQDASRCSSSLVQHLQWDTAWTQEAVPLWSSTQPEGVTARFVVTASGLTRLHPNTSASELAEEGEPHRSSLYKHAALSDELVLRSRPSTGHVLAARRIASAKSTGSTYTLAVAGVQYNASHITAVLESILAGICSPQLGVRCYVLDTAAGVLFSGGGAATGAEENGQLGKHLGQLDPQLMHMLTNASVYKQHVEYDYQGICQRHRNKESAGSRPWSVISLHFLWNGLTGLLQWLDYLRYLVISLLAAAQTTPAVALDEFGFEIHAFEHSCTQRLVRTQLTQSTSQAAQGSLGCGERPCSRQFRASRLPQTNLLLVVADAPCECPDLELSSLPYTPEDDVVPDQCTEAGHQPLFRRRPAACFAGPEGVIPACVSGAISRLTVTTAPVLLSALLVTLHCRLVAV